MKLLQSIGVVAALLGSASLVEAQGIEGLTMTSDPDDIVFTVRADEPLHTPSVQTYEGAVRLRFREMDTPQSIQVRGDGKAIKLADVRGGSRDSSVLRLDLGDATKLAAEDVRVEKRGHSVVVRIARDLLPPMAEPRSDAEKAAAPAPAVKPAPAPVKVEAKAEATAKPEASAKTPAAKPAVAAPLAKAQAKEVPLAKAMANSDSSSPMPMLIAISAILAVAYGALRLVMKKQKATQGARSAAPIDIVAQKRIGPRHQLVIVRAFGREHLLSIQGGTTTPIATSDELFEDAAPVMERTGLLADAIKPEPLVEEPPRVEKKKEEEAVFGGELLRAALAQRLKEAGQPRAKEPAARQPSKDDKALSQAVAGLVRLRRDAGLQ